MSEETVNPNDAMDEMNDYLKRLKKGMEDLIDLWQSGEIEKGNKVFFHWIEGCQAWMQLVEGIWRVFGGREAYAELPKMTINLNSQLNKLMAAFDNGDLILAGDLLEYAIFGELEYLGKETRELSLVAH